MFSITLSLDLARFIFSLGMRDGLVRQLIDSGFLLLTGLVSPAKYLPESLLFERVSRLARGGEDGLEPSTGFSIKTESKIVVGD